MKRLQSWLVVVLLGSTLVVAQGQLAEAIALFNQGKPQEAEAVIANIPAADPDYNVAKCYKALCLYALGDKQGFWKTLDPKEVRRAIPSEIKEEVWFKQVDAFLACGKFDSLSRKIHAFETNFPSSARMAAAGQYRLAGLFDCGRKKARDAYHNQDEFDLHWKVAKTNLQQFLKLAAGFTNYTVLPGRSLKEDLWAARILTGDETALFAEVQDKAEQTKLNLLRLELFVDLHREEVDANLGRLAEFVAEFPASADRERVDRVAAVINFRKGRQLTLNGQAAEAQPYFAAQRAIVDKVEVANDADALDMAEDELYSYMLAKDFKKLRELTGIAIAQSTTNQTAWVLAKLFDGIRLKEEAPISDSTKVFEELLAQGMNGEKAHDRYILNAAKWLIKAALDASDQQKAESLVQWVQSSECPKFYKQRFLKDYGWLLPTQPIKLEGGAR